MNPITYYGTGSSGIRQGWHHYWDEPRDKNVFLKEYVRGPFTRTALMFSDPYMTDDKRDSNGKPIVLKNGLPDPWTEYITFAYLLPGNGSEQNKMHKEDVNITHALRKRYRLYLGQGIPDPCLIHPYINKLDSRRDSYLVRRAPHGIIPPYEYLKKTKKKHCFCCEKKYLFECPDEPDVNQKEFICYCQNCHSQLKPACKGPPEAVSKETCTAIHYYDEPKTSNEEEEKIERNKKNSEGRENSTKIQVVENPETIEMSTGRRMKNEDVIRQRSFTIVHRDPRQNGYFPPLLFAAKDSREIISIRPQSSDKKFRLCCCPYRKKSNRLQAKELDFIKLIKPTDKKPKVVPETHIKPPSFMPPLQPSATTKEAQIQTDSFPSSGCMKRIHTESKDCKPIQSCECTSKCLLCTASQCKEPDSICPKNPHAYTDDRIRYVRKCPFDTAPLNAHPTCTCTPNVSCFYDKSKETIKKKFVENECYRSKKNDTCSKGQPTMTVKENLKLKTNQKLYCCTFTSGCDLHCNDSKNQANRNEEQDFIDKGEFTGTVKNPMFVYHCKTPSVPHILKNYLIGRKTPDNGNLDEFDCTVRRPSFHYELKSAGPKVTDFGFSLEKMRKESRENFKNFRRYNRKALPMFQTDKPGLKGECGKTSTRQIPVEIKYLNDVKRDESKTYGLLSAKSRRRKIRCAENKKVPPQKMNISTSRSQRKLKKTNEIIQENAADLLLEKSHKKMSPRNKKVVFKSSYMSYARVDPSSKSPEIRDDKTHLVGKNYASKRSPHHSQS